MKSKTVTVFKALAHPLRLKVIDMLTSGDRCVCELLPALGASQPNASQHLTILKAAELVDSYRDGTRIYYRLAYPEIAELVTVCRTITGEAGLAPHQPAEDTCVPADRV